jgi:hypothetical protein
MPCLLSAYIKNKKIPANEELDFDLSPTLFRVAFSKTSRVLKPANLSCLSHHWINRSSNLSLWTTSQADIVCPLCNENIYLSKIISMDSGASKCQIQGAPPAPPLPFFFSFLLGHLKLLFGCWESQVQESGGLKEIV